MAEIGVEVVAEVALGASFLVVGFAVLVYECYVEAD